MNVKIRLYIRAAALAVALPLALPLVALLSSCGEAEQEFPSPTFIRLEPDEQTPTRLFCGALGLEVDLPDGWSLHSWNRSNLTDEPLYSSDAEQLERVAYDEGYAVPLCELWSADDSAAEEHASLSLYAEVFDGVDYDEYIDALKSTLNRRSDGYIWALSGVENVVEHGRDWTVLVAAVQPPEGDTRYIEEYRVTELAGGTYFVACLTWWEGSEVSLEAATLARTLFTVNS